MTEKPSQWSFHAQILARALNELESACAAAPETQEYKFYRTEAPVVLEEARDALRALKQYVHDLELAKSDTPPNSTRH